MLSCTHDPHVAMTLDPAAVARSPQRKRARLSRLPPALLNYVQTRARLLRQFQEVDVWVM